MELWWIGHATAAVTTAARLSVGERAGQHRARSRQPGDLLPQAPRLGPEALLELHASTFALGIPRIGHLVQ